MLRDLVARAEAAGEAPPERALLDVPEGLLKDLRTYSEDPAVLGATRRQVAQAVESLARRLGGGR